MATRGGWGGGGGGGGGGLGDGYGKFLELYKSQNYLCDLQYTGAP